MDQELKAYLEDLKCDLANGFKSDFAGLKSDFAGLKADFAGLKADFAGLKSDFAGLKSDFAGLKADLEAKLEDQKHELLEHTEIVETRLLGEFWKWARTADARYRQNHAVVGALDYRVQAIEDRVADLESRRAS